MNVLRDIDSAGRCYHERHGGGSRARSKFEDVALTSLHTDTGHNMQSVNTERTLGGDTY